MNESIYYDETTMERCNYNDIDIDIFYNFVKKNIDYNIEKDEVKSLLRNFHLIDDKDIPTITGISFFGKEPYEFLSSLKLICAFIDGNDIAIPPSDKKEIALRIPDMIDSARSFIRMHLSESHIIEGFNPEIKIEIPEVALREALINAIAHRDYTINSPIRFIIYKDRVEIRTPGKLPNTVTIESMKVGGSHVLRNPTIYNLLIKMKMVTDMGSGVKRIIKTVKESLGKDVSFELTSSEFILTIPRKQN